MKDLRRWVEHVTAVRVDMDILAQQLASYGATVEAEKTNLVSAIPYIAQFLFCDAVVTIRFELKDWQTDSDVVLTNMTTLPAEYCRKGFGSNALQSLLRWASDNGLNEVRGTQVTKCAENEGFLTKNGFFKCPDPNPCNDFVYICSKNLPT